MPSKFPYLPTPNPITTDHTDYTIKLSSQHHKKTRTKQPRPKQHHHHIPQRKKKPPPPPRKNILTTKKRRTSPATGSFAGAHTRGGGIGDAGRRWDRKMRVRKSRDTAMAAPLRRNGERKRRGEGVERARNKEGKREKLVSSFFRLFFLTCAYLSMSGTRRWGPFCLLTCVVGGEVDRVRVGPRFPCGPHVWYRHVLVFFL